MAKYEIIIADVPDREELVAEIWHRQELIAELSGREKTNIRFYISNDTPYNYTLFMESITEAFKKLQES